jgi:hypothetical protein
MGGWLKDGGLSKGADSIPKLLARRVVVLALFETIRKNRVRSGPSTKASHVHLEVCLIVERLDRIAPADGAALLDPAIESGPIVQREINRLTEKFLKVSAGKIEPAADEDAVADAETATDQMIEWNTNHGEVAAMVSRFQLDGAELKRRIVACQRLQHFHLEQCYLAKRIGFSRISASAEKIPVAFDAAARDKVCFFNFLHRERRGRRDVDMQKPTAGPLRPAFSLFGKPRCCHRHRTRIVPPGSRSTHAL